MPFISLPNDPKPSINDQRSVPGKDNIPTDTKRGIDPTPAHVARSMPPPSEPTGSALVPRIKSSPSRESPILLSQEQQQNQQDRAPIINSQAENKMIDDMPKAQQKDEPQHEYPNRDDGKTPSINTSGTTAPGPGVRIQVTISVVPDQRKSLDVNIPTTFSVNSNWNENVIPNNIDPQVVPKPQVISNNTPQTIPKPQGLPNNTDPQAVPKPHQVTPNNTPPTVPKPQVIPNNIDPQVVPKPQVKPNNTPQIVSKPQVIPNNTPRIVPKPQGIPANITPQTVPKPQDESFCQRCQKLCSIL